MANVRGSRVVRIIRTAVHVLLISAAAGLVIFAPAQAPRTFTTQWDASEGVEVPALFYYVYVPREDVSNGVDRAVLVAEEERAAGEVGVRSRDGRRVVSIDALRPMHGRDSDNALLDDLRRVWRTELTTDGKFELHVSARGAEHDTITAEIAWHDEVERFTYRVEGNGVSPLSQDYSNRMMEGDGPALHHAGAIGLLVLSVIVGVAELVVRAGWRRVRGRGA